VGLAAKTIATDARAEAGADGGSFLRRVRILGVVVGAEDVLRAGSAREGSEGKERGAGEGRGGSEASGVHRGVSSRAHFASHVPPPRGNESRASPVEFARDRGARCTRVLDRRVNDFSPCFVGRIDFE